MIYHIINKLLYPNCLSEFLKFRALNELGKRVGSNQELFKPKISSLKWAEWASQVGWVLNKLGSLGLKRAKRVELTSSRRVMSGESGMYC